MKSLFFILATLLSLSAFSAQITPRDRSAEAAKIATIAFIKTTRSLVGDSLKNVNLYVLEISETERKISSDNLSNISKMVVEIGFDGGHGIKHSEKYEVESNSVGYVTSIKLLDY